VLIESKIDIFFIIFETSNLKRTRRLNLTKKTRSNKKKQYAISILINQLLLISKSTPNLT